MTHIFIFNILAVALILLIIWWFWIAKAKPTQIKEDEKEITVYVKDGVYTPSRIETTQTELMINFIRKDASPCSEYVVFGELDVNAQLPLDKSEKVYLKNLSPGNYNFSCQMGMYKGELIVNAK